MAVRFEVGSTFQSYSEFEEKLNAYKSSSFSDYFIKDCKTLAAAKKIHPQRVEKANEALKYYFVKLMCVHGGIHKERKTTGQRKVWSMRQGCKSFIYVKLSQDSQNLVITDMCDNHNHQELPRKKKKQNEFYPKPSKKGLNVFLSNKCATSSNYNLDQEEASPSRVTEKSGNNKRTVHDKEQSLCVTTRNNSRLTTPERKRPEEVSEEIINFQNRIANSLEKLVDVIDKHNKNVEDKLTTLNVNIETLIAIQAAKEGYPIVISQDDNANNR